MGSFHLAFIMINIYENFFLKFQATTLTTILDVDVALRNNLMNMHEIVQEVQEEVSLR